MKLLTTTIGAYPKPSYVTLPDWFSDDAGPDTEHPTEEWAAAIASMGDDAEEILARGTREVIDDQVSCGIDIPADGEVRRENYIHYHCRHLNGIDFEQLTKTSLRQGAYSARLPTITGPVSARDHFLPHDWKVAQSFTDRPVKITMPGPMTIADTTANNYYDDPAKLGADLADALNGEVLALVQAGCKHIQIDEPIFARRVPEALDYGLENLERAFRGCPEDVVRTMHMCCGYPDALDNPDYPKAPKESYFELADAVDRSSVMAVSLEDTHRRNDLELLERFPSTTIILGVIAIAKSHIESIDEVRTHLADALTHIDGARLIAAPDCGLGLLGRERTLEKLRNLCEAAHSM
jgi:5-methyltetrahydropteroyltriglutamate--homocysteine methyltransferase